MLRHVVLALLSCLLLASGQDNFLRANEEAVEEAARDLQRSRQPRNVRIKVISGKDFFNPNWLTRPDPYVKIKMGKQEVQTDYRENTKDPDYQQEFSLPYAGEKNVRFTIYDHDHVTGDDKAAYYDYDVSRMIKSGQRTYEGDLDLKHGWTGIRRGGKLRVRIELVD